MEYWIPNSFKVVTPMESTKYVTEKPSHLSRRD